MSKDMRLPAASDGGRVLLKDEDQDAERVYGLALLTRSKKKQIRELMKQIEALDTDADIDDEQEEKTIRLFCDLISVFLVGGEDAPAPGDLLFDAWVAEKITDDQITGLFQAIAGTESESVPT